MHLFGLFTSLRDVNIEQATIAFSKSNGPDKILRVIGSPRFDMGRNSCIRDNGSYIQYMFKYLFIIQCCACNDVCVSYPTCLWYEMSNYQLS